MKFSTLSLLFAAAVQVAASPVPVLEWVTVTVTVDHNVHHDAATAEAALPETTAEPSTIAFDTPATSETATSETTTAPTISAIPSTATTSTVAPSAVASSTSASSSTSTSVFSGEGTYYDTGLGACGITNVDTDFICAISKDLFDQYTPKGNPNNNSLCGKKIRAFYGSNSVEVTVVDRCEGCAYNDLDFSPSAFDLIADHALGRIDITWEWV